MPIRFVAVALAFAAMWSSSARAALSIEITRGVEAGLPIAVVPFGLQAPHDVAAIIAADLARSGRFAPLPVSDFVSQPHDEKSVVYKEWRLLKAEALVVGLVQAQPGGKYQVEFRLLDVFKERQLAGFRYTVGPELLRTVAHQIADIIHEKLTGERGAFSTRIAYITEEAQKSYSLQVADSDGYGAQTIVRSDEPLLSPAWSPDGKQLAYVSFEDKRPKVYVQDVAEGRRNLVAEFRGINSAPAWSPDGRSLALTLSREGNPEIYRYDLGARLLKRLTDDPSIDTEPSWSPDGRSIVFTSDRAGGPQIYRMDATGGVAERLTYENDYNARASFAPDGKQLVMVSGAKGRYHIAVLRLDDRSLQVVTDTVLDESPSFAPNGKMLLYATEVRGRGVLATVSVEGRRRQLYRFESGDVREPAWSPYNRDLQYIPRSGAKE